MKTILDILGTYLSVSSGEPHQTWFYTQQTTTPLQVSKFKLKTEKYNVVSKNHSSHKIKITGMIRQNENHQLL